MTQAHAEGAAGAHPALSAAARAWLFFRRWLANPLEMGSIVPSSPALGRRIADAVRAGPPGPILELGAGTGAITRALLEGGITPARLTVIEIVPEMAEVLRRSFPGVSVICGDAWRLSDILDPSLHGAIGCVVCGIPLVLLPRERQAALIRAIDTVAPGRGFLHYTYCVTSPLPIRALGLEGERIAWTPLNIPPASVWRYRLRRA
ncbi:MAG: methyltransferase domain-containing protein [Elioraea sp.]|nr:methyltransferase domain-containing protein [Elioraea sp.]MDW8443998.1 methyltransferase domain-containing protein [Acetobacteraceae bacterium]